GSLGETNSVAWMFDRKGYIVVEKERAEEEALMAAVIDAGADDMGEDGDNWEITCEIGSYDAVLEAVKALSIEPASAQATAMLPKNTIMLEGKTAQQMLRLMDALDDHDDVKQVWSNFDVEEKEIEASLA
ncbi:MAG: YebC/PmpR family DNA-binding transcriptional regulator, partial [Acidobacteria bacterium]|nr:YebC/PmpR family DNA-binding transcriptional regulator [Acidobacteriota bacterium]